MTHQPDSAVVFFSRDGNTRRGAEILNQRLGGRLIELKERKPGNSLHALLRMKTPLTGDPWARIADARRVYLMCPIWAWSSVPAMNAFADGADFTDKDVYIVTFQHTVNPQVSYNEHQYLAGVVARNHGSVRECYALVGAKMGQFAGEEHIQAQISQVKLPEELPAEVSQKEPPQEDAAPAEELGGNEELVPEEEPVLEDEPVAEEEPVLRDGLAAGEEPAWKEEPPLEEVPVSEEPQLERAPVLEEASEEEAEDGAGPREGAVPAAEALEKAPEILETLEDEPEEPISAEGAFERKLPAREAPLMP
jgi:hypothetical protein